MITQKPFGRTGHNSTRTLFGAAAFMGKITQAQVDATLDVLLEYGVNHIDTAASYDDSEVWLGPWMREHRDRFFLATKTGERQVKPAREQLHRSLERLQTDHVDLWQLHNLIDPAEWEVAMGPGGALEAAIQAHEEGLVRFIGVTGHGYTAPEMHLRSLERFDFASVLLPYNFVMMQNPDYAAGFNRLVEVCQQRNVAVQTIKSIARRPWGHTTQNRNIWYEPFIDQADIDRSVHWALGNQNIFLNTAADPELLPKVLNAASRFTARPSDEEMQAALESFGMESIFSEAHA